uniref:hypothetical protein n=1 Tax=Aminipila sp. TaxID=2060095 RepID=UPI00289E107E
MIKRRFKVAILIVIVVLALGLIISYAATGKQNSRMTSNTSTSYISQGVIGMKVSTLVSNLDKAGVSNSYTLNAVSATRGGAYVHTTDADYYYDNYDKAGKPAINSTIQKIYLTPNYKDPIAKDLDANFCLPGLRDLAMLYPASSEASMTDTVSTLAVYLKANGSEIGYYWENGVGDPEQVSANYICITKPDSKHAHVGGLGVIDGLEDNEEMYRYNNVVLANRPTNSDDTFDDDGGEKIS